LTWLDTNFGDRQPGSQSAFPPAHKCRAVRQACRVFLDWRGRELFFRAEEPSRGRLSPQFCDNVKSVAMAILSIDAGRKVREKTWPGIERCIKLRSGLYGIQSAAVGVKGL
jgi:hypothetical protein